MGDLTFLKDLGPLGGGMAGIVAVVVLMLRQMSAMQMAYATATERQHGEMLESLENCRKVVRANTVAMTEQKAVIEAVLDAVKRP